jgi:hypothetical protein
VTILEKDASVHVPSLGPFILSKLLRRGGETNCPLKDFRKEIIFAEGGCARLKAF